MPLPSLTLSSQQISSLYAMGYHFYRNGKYEDAKPIFRLLSTVQADDRKHWLGLAGCYQMLKEYKAAIECYSVAAIQNPNDPYPHWHAAECFYRSNHKEKAFTTLNSAIEIAQLDVIKFQPLISQLQLIRQVWKNKSSEAQELV